MWKYLSKVCTNISLRWNEKNILMNKNGKELKLLSADNQMIYVWMLHYSCYDFKKLCEFLKLSEDIY